ncbi:MAG: hypothetical protein N2246_11430 [Candidatus Sumerlaeia bacterium]|nr:hypothetical protein [Candidatus Sumerlaeia bacterium]
MYRLIRLICLLSLICICCAKHSVKISTDSGESKKEEGMLRIAWRLQTQQNVYGFNVYRGETENGPWVQVNKEIIPGDDTTSLPHTYEFYDRGLEVGKRYYYYVEEVTFDGKTEKITPVQSGVARPVGDYEKFKPKQP